MPSEICRLSLKLLITYICYVNLISILTLQSFSISNQFKTFLGFPYDIELNLLIKEVTIDRRFPALVAGISCNGYDSILWGLQKIFGRKSENFLRYLMHRIFWLFKVLWIMFYIQGFVFLIVSHHQLHLLIENLDLKSSEYMLNDYKVQFVWQTIVFLFTISLWSKMID